MEPALPLPDSGGALERIPAQDAARLMSETIQDAIVEVFRDADYVTPFDVMAAQVYCLGLTVAAIDAPEDREAARQTLANAIRGLRRVVRRSRETLQEPEGGAL